jgi:fatty acid desaturase
VLLLTIPPVLWLDYLSIMGEMNVYKAALIASVLGYFSFSSIHDGLHRAVSSKGWVNELVSMATVNLLFPYQPIAVLRWGHMQHHVHTGDPERDPDYPTAHSFAGMLWRGFFWADVYYTWNYFKHSSERPAREVRNVKLHLLIGGTVFVVAAVLLPKEAVIFWFIASRLTEFFIALVFMYLPHLPHTVVQKDAPYQATLIREGCDWLLTPLMAYQNWHLVHHLYPSVPFYRYKKLWNARRDFHEAQLPARVSAFQLHPDAAQLAAGLALAKTRTVR